MTSARLAAFCLWRVSHSGEALWFGSEAPFCIGVEVCVGVAGPLRVLEDLLCVRPCASTCGEGERVRRFEVGGYRQVSPGHPKLAATQRMVGRIWESRAAGTHLPHSGPSSQTCVIRAWDCRKPLLFCPAMNTAMWEHPVTAQQVGLLKAFGYVEIPCVAKKLVCGDEGGHLARLTAQGRRRAQL